MKLALAVSPFALSEPASSMRNSDHGPVRSSTDGCPPGLLTEMAVRGDAPGHCTVKGTLDGGVDEARSGVAGLAMTVPPISVLMSTPALAARGGLMDIDTTGTLPPVWKNASRMNAAFWNCFSVSGDKDRLTGLSLRQVHSGRDVSAYGARYCVKNLPMTPFGLNTLAKSPSGTSLLPPRTKG